MGLCELARLMREITEKDGPFEEYEQVLYLFTEVLFEVFKEAGM